MARISFHPAYTLAFNLKQQELATKITAYQEFLTQELLKWFKEEVVVKEHPNYADLPGVQLVIDNGVPMLDVPDDVNATNVTPIDTGHDDTKIINPVFDEPIVTPVAEITPIVTPIVTPVVSEVLPEVIPEVDSLPETTPPAV